MKSLTEEEMKKAYILWKNNYNFNEVDQNVLPFLPCISSGIDLYGDNDEVCGKSWIEDARKALFLSVDSIASRMRIPRDGFSKLECSEKYGTITMAKLAKAAEAMDCELVYAIRPKSRKLFSTIIWEQIYPEALKHPWVWKCDPKNRAGGLSCIARRTMQNSKFRKQAGWSQRANALSSK